MKHILLTALLLLVAVPGIAQDTPEIISMPDPALIDDMMGRMSALRTRYGLPAYTYNAQLSQGAQDQANWLVLTGIRTHIRPDGTGPSDRVEHFGYQPEGWCCGENYYMSIDATPDMVWDFWKWSANHRINLLHPTFQEVGIGMATNGYRHSYVLVFGSQTDTNTTHPESLTEPAETTRAAADAVPAAEPVAINEDAATADEETTAATDTNACAATHIVRNGENLFRIGLNYGSSAGQIAAANNITDVSLVPVGKSLCIPTRGAPAAVTRSVPASGGNTPTTIASAPVTPADDNWCYPGNRWGDGRCNHPDDPALEDYMWQCGWYKAHDMNHAGC